MLQKEIEGVGIPAVLITALPPTARMMKATRVVQGVGITNPAGDPEVALPAEKVLRRRLVDQCLEALTQPGGNT